MTRRQAVLEMLDGKKVFNKIWADEYHYMYFSGLGGFLQVSDYNQDTKIRAHLIADDGYEIYDESDLTPDYKYKLGPVLDGEQLYRRLEE